MVKTVNMFPVLITTTTKDDFRLKIKIKTMQANLLQIRNNQVWYDFEQSI